MNIPDKPIDVTWTDDQWKAIMASGKDILVAAAAGSGKTAVLVERMIKKIVSEDPINVDELLVVTFTNASAAEMKHRIGEVLEKEINDNPNSKHLKRQLSLLNKAQISTLHSFCLEVIRKYYYMIDLDPGFRIADETEAQLLRDECLEELFEEEYGIENNMVFFDLVDAFTSDRSDDALQRMVQEIYDFSRSNALPNAYLHSLINMYDIEEDTDLSQVAFMKYLEEDVELHLHGVRQLLEYGYELTKLPGGPAPRASTFLDDLEQVSILQKAKASSWETLYEAMKLLKFSRAKACKGDEYDTALVEEGQQVRDRAKKILQDLQGELFTRKPQSFIKDMQAMKPHVQTLVHLVQAFGEKFQEIKVEKGLVDFADLEHYCLSILRDPINEDELTPSVAALEYRKQFKEVLIDEYQDTNMVQESILQLVTKDVESEGNLFMVGDIKQSIYRFRLAEPTLFLSKYLRYQEREDAGYKIDLAKNFRSRKEVLEGTNFIFKQIMGSQVGEIEYDESAELKLGASYPEDKAYPIEVALINQSSSESEDMDVDVEGINATELEQAELEARVIAKKVRDILESKQEVYDAKQKVYRPTRYKDMVILLRSMTWAPQIMEELKQFNIPTYANLSTGYFESTEVDIMMSLLKVIDNPYQDIPLASVLRSPIVGLNEEELSRIRIASKQGSFYDAIQSYLKSGANKEEQGYEELKRFFEKFSMWRTDARRGSLSELIWKLYRETYFYDFVGGLPAGNQRQANLRALYDRARSYEETSFRGLFRFLRFIERMRDRGNDLGAARALTEQEDVIRIMTIHSSKGLEFPFVFIAGTGRNFNTMDLRKSFLLDKDLGFATKYIDPKRRISYPSLPQMAFSKKKKMELLAEEMRVLYVALTRAKEKLILIGTVKDIEKAKQKWSQMAMHSNWLLNEFDRASAKSYLDWIGPSLVRHKDAENIHLESWIEKEEISSHSSSWEVRILNKEELIHLDLDEQKEEEEWLKRVTEGKRMDSISPHYEQIEETLKWAYEHPKSTSHRSKQSVSELKRQNELRDVQSGTEIAKAWKNTVWNRPKFMQEKKLSPAEIGTAMHMVMQHVELKTEITEAYIHELVNNMVQKELLTDEQAEVINAASIVTFFQSTIGQRMRLAPKVVREIPFNIAYPASKVYADWKGAEESVLVQGIIDVYFEDEEGTVLLDYKTDTITGKFKGGYEEAKPKLEARYKVQMELYTDALETILKRKIEEKYLFFFDGAHILPL